MFNIAGGVVKRSVGGLSRLVSGAEVVVVGGVRTHSVTLSLLRMPQSSPGLRWHWYSSASCNVAPLISKLKFPIAKKPRARVWKFLEKNFNNERKRSELPSESSPIIWYRSYACSWRSGPEPNPSLATGPCLWNLRRRTLKQSSLPKALH